MRILINTILIVFYLFFTMLISGCDSQREEGYYVENVEFNLTDTHNSFMSTKLSGKRIRLDDSTKNFYVRGHELKKGNGLIITFREFSASYFQLDSAGYHAVSIYLALDTDITASKIYFNNNLDVIGFVSSRNSSLNL